MAAKQPAITTMTCGKCGEQASGPDSKSVQAAMDRHKAKKHASK